MCRGTTGGCTPAWCSQRRRRRMVRTLMSFQPSQMPGRRHQLSSGCHCCIPSLLQWKFLVLSPTLALWKSMKVWGFWHSGLPLWEQPLHEAQGSRLGTQRGWRRGSRQSCGYTGSGHYATAQSTAALPNSRQPGAHYRLVKSWPNSISLFTSLRLSKAWHRGRG